MRVSGSSSGSSEYHRGSTVYLRQEIGGKLGWRNGVVLEREGNSLVIAVGLGSAEKGQASLEVAQTPIGLVDADVTCVIQERPRDLEVVEMPALEKLMSAY